MATRAVFSFKFVGVWVAGFSTSGTPHNTGVDAEQTGVSHALMLSVGGYNYGEQQPPGNGGW